MRKQSKLELSLTNENIMAATKARANGATYQEIAEGILKISRRYESAARSSGKRQFERKEETCYSNYYYFMTLANNHLAGLKMTKLAKEGLETAKRLEEKHAKAEARRQTKRRARERQRRIEEAKRRRQREAEIKEIEAQIAEDRAVIDRMNAKSAREWWNYDRNALVEALERRANSDCERSHKMACLIQKQINRSDEDNREYIGYSNSDSWESNRTRMHIEADGAEDEGNDLRAKIIREYINSIDLRLKNS